MAAKFIAEEGELKGLTLSLDEGNEWVIGRDPEACQLLVEDPVASRKHLLCRSSPQGIILENLSQTNPVQVNQEEVKGPRLLKHGDAVKIGSGIFRFYEELGAKAIPNTKREEGENMTADSESEAEPTHETIYKEISEEDKGILAEIDFDLRDTGRWLLKVIGGPNNGAEFSMQSAIEAVKPLKSMILSKHHETSRVADHFLKTTAILMQLQSGGEDFRQVLHPQMTAYRQ